MSNYRKVAEALAPHMDTPTALVHAVSSVLYALNLQDDGAVVLSEHDKLVMRAANDNEVLRNLAGHRKIHAIKRLREIEACGLKAAKEAVEDPRVVDMALSRGWRYGDGSMDEPPF